MEADQSVSYPTIMVDATSMDIIRKNGGFLDHKLKNIIENPLDVSTDGKLATFITRYTRYTLRFDTTEDLVEWQLTYL